MRIYARIRIFINFWDSGGLTLFPISTENLHTNLAISYVLGINTRTAHFVDNMDRSCTFCKKSNVPMPSPETFVHLFYECPFTEAIQTHFAVTYLRELQLRTASDKKIFWFCGISPTRTVGGGIFLYIISSTLMFTIWEQKQTLYCYS